MSSVLNLGAGAEHLARHDHPDVQEGLLSAEEITRWHESGQAYDVGSSPTRWSPKPCAQRGPRYELWCIARALATRYAVLHCEAAPQRCRDWNSARKAGGEPAYDEHVLNGLIERFERPDGRNRWDAPLFTCVTPKE